MKASDLFVKCLENEGVERIFGLPGEENADLMISLKKSSIEFVPLRHGQGRALRVDGRGVRRVGASRFHHGRWARPHRLAARSALPLRW